MFRSFEPDDTQSTINLIKNGMTVKINDDIALTRIFTGQKMLVDVRDLSMAPHLLLDGEWEMPTTLVLKRLLKRDSVFLDVGSCFGYFSLVAGTIIRSGKIIAFEPNKNLIGLLKKNFMINGLTHLVKIENMAISDQSGQAELKVHEYLLGGSSLNKFFWEDSDTEKTFDSHLYKTMSVPTISIDEYCQKSNIQKIDCIKIDVEGVEDKVFAGMKKTISTNPQIKILLEFGDGRHESGSQQFFSELQKEFPFIYNITDRRLQRLTSYEHLKANTTSDGWIMLLLSKAK